MPFPPRTSAAQAAAELGQAGYLLAEKLPPYVDTRKWIKVKCLTCEGSRSVSLCKVRLGHVRCKHIAISAKYAVKLLADADLKNLEPYPGKRTSRWKVRCTRPGCGAQHRISLSRVVSEERWRCPCVREEEVRACKAAQARSEFRAAGYEPQGDYPDTAHHPWPSVCITCGGKYRPSLSTIRMGQVCAHRKPWNRENG